MVLAYYGIELTEEEILNGTDVDDEGIEVVSLGTFLIKQGFKVTTHYLPAYLPPNLLTNMKLLNWMHSHLLKSDKSLPEHEGFRRRLKEIREFVKNEGKFILSPVSFNSIAEEIRQKRPVILNLDMAYLWGAKERGHGHFVVVKEIDDSMISFNDPNFSYGGEVIYPIDIVMHACYIWKASALFVQKRG